MKHPATVLHGKHIALVGFGKESIALARFAAMAGAASITATDSSSAEKLAPALAAVSDLPVPVRLLAGATNPSAWETADVIFVSPGITPGFTINLPGIAEAAERGAIISNHTQLLFEYAPVPIVAITGSAGKTTTTTLLGEMLQRQGGRHVYVGGNMGIPLINEVAKMAPEDIIVLEISEVQLARLHASPHIGAITNITPDHYDRYPTFADYVRAKRQIARDMQPTDFAILNQDNAPSRESQAETAAQCLFVSQREQVQMGADVRDGAFWLHLPGQPSVRLAALGDTKLPGTHNIENILFASVAAALVGAAPEAITEAICTFTGVQHRIQFIAEKQGVSYYSDSIATAPNRMIAALRSFSDPILLIAGGKDKNLPWDEAASEIVRRVRVIAVLGVSAPIILEAIAQAQQQIPIAEQMLERIEQVATIEAATQTLMQSAHSGEVVLLSPGCASHDMFSGYEERGQRFIDTVLA